MARTRQIFTAAVAGCLLLFLMASLPGLAPAAAPAWQRAPVVPALGAKAKKQVRSTVKAGRKKGNRAGVFAKAGDSNTEMSPALYGLGCAKPSYGQHRYLASVVRKYRRIRLKNPDGFPGCRSGNSFSRRSVATRSATWAGWSSTRINEINPAYAPLGSCHQWETPLACEIKAVRPRFLLLMSGTNDLGYDYYFDLVPGAHVGERLEPAVNQALARGVLPVLSTIPPIHSADPELKETWDAGVLRTNAGIYRLARRRNLPMINLWRALVSPGMVNQGISADTVHLSLFGGALPTLYPGADTFRNSINFTAAGLRYGTNRRNLIWLKTLAKLDRITAAR